MNSQSFKVTIGAFLMAGITFALGKIRKSPEMENFCFDVEVNLRNRFSKPLGLDHVACLIGGFPMIPEWEKLIKHLQQVHQTSHDGTNFQTFLFNLKVAWPDSCRY